MSDEHQGWWHRAACKATPHWHTADYAGNRGTRAAMLATHVCIEHCPVLGDCAADAKRLPPYSVVQGGILWTGKRGGRGQPAPTQPEPIGCGAFCAHLGALAGAR